MHKLTRTPKILALVALTPLLTACASGSQTRAGLAQSAPNVTMTTPELRIRMSLLAEGFSAIVEAAADSIMEQATEVDIKRRALMWKASAIPNFQQSVFISDPLAALIDGWAFILQMEEFFATGAGSDVFGDLQPMAVRASAVLVNHATTIARIATTDSGYVNGEQFVTEWTRDHPIQSLLFARQHTATAWAALLGGGARGGLAAAADINESITVISNRMSMYAAALPKQARWQAEIMLWEVLDDPQTQAFLGEVASIDSAVVSIGEQFGDIRNVFVDIDDILNRTVDRAFEEMDEQVAAMMDSALQENGAFAAMIDAQRQAIFDDVSAQRVAAMEELDSVVQHAVRVAVADSTEVIDHLFLRIVQLLAGLIVIVVIAGAIFMRRKRPA